MRVWLYFGENAVPLALGATALAGAAGFVAIDRLFRATWMFMLAAIIEVIGLYWSGATPQMRLAGLSFYYYICLFAGAALFVPANSPVFLRLYPFWVLVPSVAYLVLAVLWVSGQAQPFIHFFLRPKASSVIAAVAVLLTLFYATASLQRWSARRKAARQLSAATALRARRAQALEYTRVNTQPAVRAETAPESVVVPDKAAAEPAPPTVFVDPAPSAESTAAPKLAKRRPPKKPV